MHAWGFRLYSAEKEEYGNLPEGTAGLNIRLEQARVVGKAHKTGGSVIDAPNGNQR